MTFRNSEIAQKLIASGMRMKRVASLLHTSLRTLARVVTNPNRLRGTRKTAAKVFRRRKIVLRLVTERKRKERRTWPVNPSANVVRLRLLERGIVVSKSTVTRDLHSLKLTPYVRPAVPTLSRDPERVAFARRHQKTSSDNIVFSDEHFVTINDRGARTMWCRCKEDVCPRENQRRQNVPNFMIWGAIGVGYRSPLVIFPRVDQGDEGPIGWRLTADRYRRMCLQKIVPHLISENKTFMHDGAMVHQARAVKQYLVNKGVRVLEPWPASSPDLNPIEDLWAHVDRKISEKCPLTNDELQSAVEQVWAEIPQHVIDKFVRSFKKKCATVAGRM